ncbi:MAG: DUF4956 domain-containing protein [Eubacterium sp.]|nr:DUF4956 domain-containing protein [Eubacterium sp.]
MYAVLFSGLFNSTGITVPGFFICLVIAIVLGAVVSIVHTLCEESSRGYNITLALIPPIVCVIIMMVSGSLGAGIAVAGTFSLIRFRSRPGTATEICSIFLGMASGLACGMGYPGFGILFAVILCVIMFLYHRFGFGARKEGPLNRVLNITVPEDSSFTDMFDDVFEKYTSSCTLVRIKTTNLGSLLKLRYELVLSQAGTEKAFIDELRTRNGNLELNLAFKAESENDL